MGQITEIPLASGMEQGTDRAVLASDRLSYAQNCRLTRDGRLEVRPSFTALSTATMSTGTLTAFDLANYAGRLVALGDSTASGRITDVFEWGARISKWRGSAGDSTSDAALRLPQLTDVRSVGQLPDQFLDVQNVKLAAGAGYVCAVANYGNTPTAPSLVHIFDPATNQTLFCATVALKLCTVVFAGTKFWIGGADASNFLCLVGFDPLVDETLAAPTQITSIGLGPIDVAGDNFGTGFILGGLGSNGLVARRFSGAGANLGGVVQLGSLSSLAIAGGSALYSIGTLDLAGGDFNIRSYNSSDALVTGPTTIVSGTTVPRLSLRNRGGGVVTAIVCIGGDSVVRNINQTTHAANALTNYFDARLTCSSVITPSFRTFAAFVDREADSANVGTNHIVDVDTYVPQAFLLPQLASPGGVGNNNVSQSCLAGTKVYFPVLSVLQDLGTGTRKARFSVYEAETSATARRQMAQVGGELLIAGGLPMTYEGRTLAEQGFAERPVVVSSTQGTGGSLTLLGVYNAIPVWEVFDGKGRLLHSQAGSPGVRTLTGANNSITWTLTTPHSLRRHPFYRNQAFSLRVSLYRTEAGEGVFFLDKQQVIDPATNPAEQLTITSTQSDVNLIDNLVLYEQSQTPLSHVAPTPYRYVWPARERALNGGQPEEEAWTESKLLFPGEPVTWASPNQLGFSSRVGRPITAVGSFETVGLLWTAQEIWQIPGRGPEHDGTGDFDATSPVASPGGCADWRSVIVAPAGAFFQMRPDMLMLLTRGGEVQWIGFPVQDTLAAYPVVAGAVFVRALDQVVFACNNNAGTDGVFLVYDLAKTQWFVDTIGAPISAVSELDGRLVYASGGAVFQQDAAIASGVGALPSVRIQQHFRPFTALGYGDIVKLGLVGTYLGDCTVEAFISYDDGANFTSLGPQAVTAAAWTNPVTGNPIASGDPITLLYTPHIRTVDRFAMRVDITNSVNTGAVRLHVVSFEVEAQQGTARKPARDNR